MQYIRKNDDFLAEYSKNLKMNFDPLAAHAMEELHTETEFVLAQKKQLADKELGWMPIRLQTELMEQTVGCEQDQEVQMV